MSLEPVLDAIGTGAMWVITHWREEILVASFATSILAYLAAKTAMQFAAHRAR